MGTFSLASKIKEVVNTKWSMINTFTVDITIGSKLLKAAKVNPELFNRENFNLVLKEFPLPQSNVADTESQTDIINRHTMGRIGECSFDVTFRDRDQLVYYRAIKRMFQAARWMYPDDIGISFKVYKDPDYYGEDMIEVDNLNRCIMTDISAVNFNQETDAQIAEFSVSFKVMERPAPSEK